MEVSQFFFTLPVLDPNVSVGTLLSNVTPEGFTRFDYEAFW